MLNWWIISVSMWIHRNTIHASVPYRVIIHGQYHRSRIRFKDVKNRSKSFFLYIYLFLSFVCCMWHQPYLSPDSFHRDTNLGTMKRETNDMLKWRLFLLIEHLANAPCVRWLLYHEPVVRYVWEQTERPPSRQRCGVTTRGIRGSWENAANIPPIYSH